MLLGMSSAGCASGQRASPQKRTIGPSWRLAFCNRFVRVVGAEIAYIVAIWRGRFFFMAMRGQFVLVALLVCARGAVADELTGLEFFEKQIRPILAARCHQCHGPEKQESDLRLDSASSALQGGVYGP